MRKATIAALLVYLLISRGAAAVGPFQSRFDCESYRLQHSAFAYCVPLWE